MQKVLIMATLVTVLLVSMITITILPEPVEAWEASTNYDIWRPVMYVLESNINTRQDLSSETKQELQEIYGLLGTKVWWNHNTNEESSSADPDARNIYYWMVVADGAQDADGAAYNRDGSKKTFHFEYRIPLGPTLQWDGLGDERIGWRPLPEWLKGLLGPLALKIPYYAELDQFQDGYSLDRPPFYCTNLRTAGETANDYFKLALQSWGSGRKAKAMWWLGMASHMIQDMFANFHATTDRSRLFNPWAWHAYMSLCGQAADPQTFATYNMGNPNNLWEGLPLIKYVYNDKHLNNPDLRFDGAPSFQDFFRYDLNWDPFTWVAHSSAFAHTYRGWMDGIGEERSRISLFYALGASQLRMAQFIHYFWRTKVEPPTFHGFRSVVWIGNPWDVTDRRTMVVSGSYVDVNWVIWSEPDYQLPTFYLYAWHPEWGNAPNPAWQAIADPNLGSLGLLDSPEYHTDFWGIFPFIFPPYLPSWSEANLRDRSQPVTLASVGIDRPGYGWHGTLTWKVFDIEEDTPVTGKLMLECVGTSADGQFAGTYARQDFSVVPSSGSMEATRRMLTIPSVSVQVVSPIDMEKRMANAICPIVWDAEADLGVHHVDIYYRATKGEGTAYDVTAIGFPNTGRFIWQIPSELDGYDCTLFVRGYDSMGNWAEDSVDVTIRGKGTGYPAPEPPSVTVISPNGG
jgi:hypothetical protein